MAWCYNGNVFGVLFSRICAGHVFEGSGLGDEPELHALLVCVMWLH